MIEKRLIDFIAELQVIADENPDAIVVVRNKDAKTMCDIKHSATVAIEKFQRVDPSSNIDFLKSPPKAKWQWCKQAVIE